MIALHPFLRRRPNVEGLTELELYDRIDKARGRVLRMETDRDLAFGPAMDTEALDAWDRRNGKALARARLLLMFLVDELTRRHAVTARHADLIDRAIPEGHDDRPAEH